MLLVCTPGCDIGSVRALGAGVTLLAPRSAAKPLWLALVYAGGHAVGFSERAGLDFEAARASYPRDWPDTAAGRALLEAEGAELRDRHEARPPAKRPNFARLGVAAPFVVPWAALVGGSERFFVCRTAADVRRAMESNAPDALVCGTLECARGVVKPRAALYLTPSGKEEEPVGFVTTGGFSSTSGCARGVACCVLRRCYERADDACAGRPCTLHALNTTATTRRAAVFVPLLGEAWKWT